MQNLRGGSALFPPFIWGLAGETPKQFHKKDGVRIAAHVRDRFDACTCRSEKFAGPNKSYAVNLLQYGVPGGLLESHFGLASGAVETPQHVNGGQPFTGMEPDCLKGGRDRRIDYSQPSAGCAPDKPGYAKPATFPARCLSMDDLIQQFRACNS